MVYSAFERAMTGVWWFCVELPRDWYYSKKFTTGDGILIITIVVTIFFLVLVRVKP